MANTLRSLGLPIQEELQVRAQLNPSKLGWLVRLSLQALVKRGWLMWLLRHRHSGGSWVCIVYFWLRRACLCMQPAGAVSVWALLEGDNQNLDGVEEVATGRKEGLRGLVDKLIAGPPFHQQPSVPSLSPSTLPGPLRETLCCPYQGIAGRAPLGILPALLHCVLCRWARVRKWMRRRVTEPLPPLSGSCSRFFNLTILPARCCRWSPGCW